MPDNANTASFKISLDADETSGAANDATDALKQLRTAIKSDVSELAEMQKAMKNLQGSSVVNIKQFRELSSAITGKKAAIAQAQSSFLSLGGSFKKAAPPPDIRNRFQELTKAAGQMPGPLGEMTGKLGKLRATLAGNATAIGIVAIVAALAALVVGTIAAGVALTNYAITQGDARRSELLRLEGLTKLRSYYGFVAGNAKEMQAGIDQVSASTALSRDKVTELNNQLYRMGLRGPNLQSALEGVAIKTSVMGDAAGQSAAQWAAGAALTGQSVSKLTDRIKSQLGGIAQKQMASLAVQAMKQKEGFDALFSSIDVEPFLAAKKSVTDLLSQSQSSGRALKALMSSIVQPLVDMAAKAQPLIKRFFQGMIIAALQLDIAWLSLRLKFRELFGKSAAIKATGDSMKTALGLGEAALYALAAAFGVAAVAAVSLSIAALPLLWGIATAIGAATLSAVLFAAPWILVGAAIAAVINTAYLLYELWKEIDWPSLGDSIIQGIENGLGAGASHLVESIGNLGTQLWSSFKAKLGIASPSKMFAKLGLAIPEGVSAGIETGTPDARRSVSDLIDTPRIPVARDGAAADGGKPAGASAAPSVVNNYNFGDIVLSGKHGEDAKSMAEEFREEFEKVLEGVSLQMGVGEAA